MHEITCTRCRKPIAVFEKRLDYWTSGDTPHPAMVWCETCMPVMLLVLLGRFTSGELLR